MASNACSSAVGDQGRGGGRAQSCLLPAPRFLWVTAVSLQLAAPPEPGCDTVILSDSFQLSLLLF